MKKKNYIDWFAQHTKMIVWTIWRIYKIKIIYLCTMIVAGRDETHFFLVKIEAVDELGVGLHLFQLLPGLYIPPGQESLCVGGYDRLVELSPTRLSDFHCSRDLKKRVLLHIFHMLGHTVNFHHGSLTHDVVRQIDHQLVSQRELHVTYGHFVILLVKHLSCRCVPQKSGGVGASSDHSCGVIFYYIFLLISKRWVINCSFSQLMSSELTDPLCPSYVPTLSPFSAYHAVQTLSFPQLNRMSPSLLNFILFTALSCPWRISGLYNWKHNKWKKIRMAEKESTRRQTISFFFLIISPFAFFFFSLETWYLFKNRIGKMRLVTNAFF